MVVKVEWNPPQPIDIQSLWESPLIYDIYINLGDLYISNLYNCTFGYACVFCVYKYKYAADIHAAAITIPRTALTQHQVLRPARTSSLCKGSLLCRGC